MASAALKPQDVEEGAVIPGEEEQSAPRDFEAEAREHGWSPKEEFKGDPTRWVDAEAFMKRADDMMPLLRATNRRLKADMDSLKKDLKRATAHFEGAEKRAYERAMADLEQKHAEAVEAGDVKAAGAAAKEMRELAPSDGGWAAGKTQAEIKQEATEALDLVREEHPWYDKANLAGATETEQLGRIFFDRMCDKHIDKTNEMAPADFFAFVTDLTLEKYPQLKDKPARTKPASAVEGGSGGRPRGSAKSWDNLPLEAKRQYERYQTRGILGVKSSGDKEKDLVASRAYYARSHDWEGYAQ